MTLLHLKEALASAPLTIRLVSGRSFHLDHTDYALLSRKGDALFLVTDDDRLVNIATRAIESIEPDGSPAVVT